MVHWHLLVVNCHPISSQLAHLHWIGGLHTQPTKKIWPKSRLLIGRELRMLASHWSRGPTENFQRGYPYDIVPVSIEWFWPQLTQDWFMSDWMYLNLLLIRSWLASDWMLIGIKLVFNWHQIGCQFVSDWLLICFKLVVNWYYIGGQFALNLVLIVFKFFVNRHLIGCQ